MHIIIEHVVTIIKYFRNHQLLSNWYKEDGELVMPLEVRWNTHCDVLESFVQNWSVSEQFRLHKSFNESIGK